MAECDNPFNKSDTITTNSPLEPISNTVAEPIVNVALNHLSEKRPTVYIYSEIINWYESKEKMRELSRQKSEHLTHYNATTLGCIKYTICDNKLKDYDEFCEQICSECKRIKGCETLQEMLVVLSEISPHQLVISKIENDYMVDIICPNFLNEFKDIQIMVLERHELIEKKTNNKLEKVTNCDSIEDDDGEENTVRDKNNKIIGHYFCIKIQSIIETKDSKRTLTICTTFLDSSKNKNNYHKRLENDLKLLIKDLLIYNRVSLTQNQLAINNENCLKKQLIVKDSNENELEISNGMDIIISDFIEEKCAKQDEKTKECCFLFQIINLLALNLKIDIAKLEIDQSDTKKLRKVLEDYIAQFRHKGDEIKEDLLRQHTNIMLKKSITIAKNCEINNNLFKRFPAQLVSYFKTNPTYEDEFQSNEDDQKKEKFGVENIDSKNSVTEIPISTYSQLFWKIVDLIGK